MPAYAPYDPAEEKRFFQEGIDLFNEGEFFEAHEAWEEIWKNTAGRKAKFYQGLIQAAVTLEHMNRANPRGVQRVWASMLTKFDGLPEVFMGVNTTQFLGALRLVVAHVLEMETVPGQQPYDVELKWNRHRVPKVQLLYDPFDTGEAADLDRAP